MKWRIIFTTLFLIIVLLCGTGIWLRETFLNMPFGMMGGDCPERTSYTSVEITGNVVNNSANPNAKVSILANKPKGACPQSEAINNQEMIIVAGEEFGASYGMYLGDPNLKVVISTEGYDSCELRFSGAAAQEKMDLQITLGSELLIAAKTERSRYSMDDKGQWIIVTDIPFGSPSYNQICPKTDA
ncbi:MAG: hypothetical protein LCI00_24585 [Chloroflexi bacterium]|nr:hypothetical protein [Chloroflexota bacterium]MCC6895838.1 hypothetical protein [Anaerolineae bacterium]